MYVWVLIFVLLFFNHQRYWAQVQTEQNEMVHRQNWAIWSYGLNILDTNKDRFESYTEKDGLINNIVYGVLVDDDNNIWMSTNGGISRLSTKKDVFENFTIIDGLQSNEFNGRSCFKANTGYMYFGGVSKE